MKENTQSALPFGKAFKMPGMSFQVLDTLNTVPPTDAILVGSTDLSDGGTPTNATEYNVCCASMIELTRVPGF